MSLFSGVSGDDGIHPEARILINNIVSKRFGLTKAEVSGLTIEEKARMMKSTFSEAEITRLIEEEMTHLFAPFKTLLYLCFPALAEYEKEIARQDSAPPTFDYFYLIFLPIPCFFAYLALNTLAKRCSTSAKWLLNKVFPSSQHGVARLTNNAAQLEPQNLSERCFCFTKSKYSRTPKLKGLKGIAETYIQELTQTQEVEQHQEGTSGAVVASSRSTVDDHNSLS